MAHRAKGASKTSVLWKSRDFNVKLGYPKKCDNNKKVSYELMSQHGGDSKKCDNDEKLRDMEKQDNNGKLWAHVRIWRRLRTNTGQ